MTALHALQASLNWHHFAGDSPLRHPNACFVGSRQHLADGLTYISYVFLLRILDRLNLGIWYIAKYF